MGQALRYVNSRIQMVFRVLDLIQSCGGRCASPWAPLKQFCRHLCRNVTSVVVKSLGKSPADANHLPLVCLGASDLSDLLSRRRAACVLYLNSAGRSLKKVMLAVDYSSNPDSGRSYRRIYHALQHASSCSYPALP